MVVQPSNRRPTKREADAVRWTPARPGGGIQYEVAESRRAPVGGRARPGITFTPAMGVAVVLGLVVTLLWLSVPAGLNDSAPPPADPTYEEASLRRALAITSDRIEAFERSHGGIPETLEEIPGNPWDVIGYERVSGHRYRLTAPSSRGPIVFDSIAQSNDVVAPVANQAPRSGRVKS